MMMAKTSDKNCKAFKIGDTVMLQSASFAMTIIQIDEEAETATCCWEPKDTGTLREKTLPLAALTEYEELPTDLASFLEDHGREGSRADE